MKSDIQRLRETSLDSKTNNPAWWTPVRTAVFKALVTRSEIAVRMKTKDGPHKVSDRWRCYSPPRTRHLFQMQDMEVLTEKNVGPAIRNLSDWGYLVGTATTVRRVDFTTKGWAQAAFMGFIEPAWLEVIFERHPDERKLAWQLYHRMKSSEKLRNLSQGYEAGMTKQIIEDVTDDTDLANLPFVESEIPGLPQFDEEVEGILAERAKNPDEVQRRMLQLARDFHHKTGPSLREVEPQKLAEAIGQHFTTEEVLRADLEMIREQRSGPRESYYSRELVRRMSEAGQFKAPTLADHLELNPGHGARGVSRIALALETQELQEEGLARGMGGDATLGDVYDRISAEKAAGLHGISNMPGSDIDAVEASPENIAAASAAAKAEDDALPMVDWIDRQIAQYAYDGWVPEGQVGIIARGAVLRHMRQNPAGAPIIMSGEKPFTQFDGHRLHVRFSGHALDGRPCMFSLTVDSDYDEKDTANIESWFSGFVARGLDTTERRTYHYPVGSKVEHERVEGIELVKVSPGYHPLTAFALGILGGLTALGGLMIALSFVPNIN